MATQTAQPDPGPGNDRASIVRLVNIHKSFDDNQVLEGLDLEFPTGRTTVVLGPSGCGKSVMLKHVIGLIKPDRGEVWYEQTRVDPLRESELGAIRRQFGFLFQHSALFDSLSVRDNIAFPLVEHTRYSPEKRLERVRHVLGLVGLIEAIDQMPASLSGGQRKRIALARAIVLQPRVILYDEPTTGLDPIRADVINDLILKLQRELHATSIVVTHDLHSAFRLADEMVMLHEGRPVLKGPPEVFRQSTDPIVQRFLSGDSSDPSRPDSMREVKLVTGPAHGGLPND
jgi:phospholipid/cholesterol/gamma-HCH transport system ATP-binding protein